MCIRPNIIMHLLGICLFNTRKNLSKQFNSFATYFGLGNTTRMWTKINVHVFNYFRTCITFPICKFFHTVQSPNEDFFLFLVISALLVLGDLRQFCVENRKFLLKLFRKFTSSINNNFKCWSSDNLLPS